MRVTCSLHSSGYTQYSELSYDYPLISLGLPFDFPNLDFSSTSTRFDMSSLGVGGEMFGLASTCLNLASKLVDLAIGYFGIKFNLLPSVGVHTCFYDFQL